MIAWAEVEHQYPYMIQTSHEDKKKNFLKKNQFNMSVLISLSAPHWHYSHCSEGISIQSLLTHAA